MPLTGKQMLKLAKKNGWQEVRQKEEVTIFCKKMAFL